MKKSCMQVCVWFVICLSVFWSQSVHATEGTTLLPSEILIGDDTGVKAQQNGNYFLHIQDIAPGKPVHKKITIVSTTKNKQYRLTLSMEDKVSEERALDLSEKVEMTLTYDGKVIFQGLLSGKGTTQDLRNSEEALDLGVFSGGDTKMLEAVFEIDGEKYTNDDFSKKSVFENSWKFKAVQVVPEDDAPFWRFPQTGEEWRSTLLFASIGLFFVLLALLIFKYKQKENSDDAQ